MEIAKIYFDMDGVLADFDRGVRELCGLHNETQGQSSQEYEDLLWNTLKETEHFYGRLEVIEGAKEMFDEIYEKFGNRCEILTGIPKPKRGMPTAAEDKVQWMHRHFSEDIVIHTVFRKDKIQKCYGKNCILIDDYDVNIREWECAGGTGILFQTPAQVLQELYGICEK